MENILSRLLDELIEVEEQIDLGRSDMTSGEKYHIILKRSDYPDRILEFDFHDNFYNNSNIGDWLCCLALDSMYMEYNEDENLESALEENDRNLKNFLDAVEFDQLCRLAAEW